MKRALFISDVHLGGFDESVNKKVEDELIHLIDYCQRQQYSLYILGDLFDYWMEYPGHAPILAERVQKKFHKYNQQFGPTLYITGNHDNWTRSHLPSLGFDLEKNMRSEQFGAKKVWMLHGDGLDEAGLQLPRPPLHRLLRHPLFVRIYQTLLPPRFGLKGMKAFSRLTRYLDGGRGREKKLNKWAGIQLKEKDVDVIICGHDHIPRDKEFDFGRFINLGTFYMHRTLAEYNNGAFSLVQWSDDAKELKPYFSQD